MFRKPKKGGKKAGLRRKASDDKGDTKDGDDHEDDAGIDREELRSAKRSKLNSATANSKTHKAETTTKLMHQFDATDGPSGPSASELATSTVQHHPETISREHPNDNDNNNDNTSTKKTSTTTQKRNKLLAGPIKAPTNIRTTCRFDYQPDICKDYKDTGFCGFGDTCIYLHDRGDTMTGWQLEQQWEEQQKKKQQLQEAQIQQFLDQSNNNNGSKSNQLGDLLTTDDGIPFACYLCREAFKDPIVTTCGHYFCEACIMDHVKASSATADSSTSNCPICSKDTFRVFNEPTKLLAKKRRVLSTSKGSWDDFYNAFATKST